jgi:hypothetical protein
VSDRKVLLAVDRKLKSFLETDARPLASTVYHYTSLAGFQGITQDGYVWATHSDYLNDASEARHLLSVITKNVRDWKIQEDIDYSSARSQLLSFIEEPIATQHFIASFSEVGDSLSQWRAYCKQGGVSLGISPHSLLSADVVNQAGVRIRDVDLNLFKVRYISHESFSEATDGLLEFFSIWLEQAEDDAQRRMLYENVLGSLVCHYKHAGFLEEREWRLVVSEESPSRDLQLDFRPSVSSLIPYVQVRLFGNRAETRSLDQIVTEVIVGPGSHMELNRRAIERYLAQRGMSQIPVRCSSIPYRHW